MHSLHTSHITIHVYLRIFYAPLQERPNFHQSYINSGQVIRMTLRRGLVCKEYQPSVDTNTGSLVAATGRCASARSDVLLGRRHRRLQQGVKKSADWTETKGLFVTAVLAAAVSPQPLELRVYSRSSLSLVTSAQFRKGWCLGRRAQR